MSLWGATLASNMEDDSRDAPPGVLGNVLLPHLPRAQIEAIYLAAPGNEIGTGKFENPESSAVLVANAFGFFLDRPGIFPVLPHLEALRWPASELSLERPIRFPWAGGRHPCLDVVVRTPDALIGIESKRYEPYRPKQRKRHSAAYRRDVWGSQMRGYVQALEIAESRPGLFPRLDAAQLVKHALALRTQIHRAGDECRRGVLYYLYADPIQWPDGSPVSSDLRSQHEDDIQRFREFVADCEVRFISAKYSEVLESWLRSEHASVAAHATAVATWLGNDE